MATPSPDAAPPPPEPPARLPSPTPLGLAALIVSGLCTAWLGVEIWLRVERSPGWMVTGSFVVAIALAVVVVVLAVLAWRRDGRRGAIWGLLAIATATSDRLVLALFTLLMPLG